MKFLSIGECMMELAPQADGLYSVGFAGDTFNTAWYLAQHAGDTVAVHYLTAVGDDQPSAQMVAFMKAAGVQPLVSLCKGRSVGLYMISLQDGERSFSYWRDTSAARTLADTPLDLPLAAGDVAYFSGITLAILPQAGRETLLAGLSDARARGVRVIFDPNLRPRLWSSAEDMLHWTTQGAAISDICLPSFEDEATHFGDATPAETCARYQAGGTPVVIVKNGPDPVTIFDHGKMSEVAIPPVAAVVDTTAAGDSFNAAFCQSYLSGDTLETAVVAGAQLSAKVIGQKGALVLVD